jgi:hypothetical protein
MIRRVKASEVATVYATGAARHRLRRWYGDVDTCAPSSRWSRRARPLAGTRGDGRGDVRVGRSIEGQRRRRAERADAASHPRPDRRQPGHRPYADRSRLRHAYAEMEHSPLRRMGASACSPRDALITPRRRRRRAVASRRAPVAASTRTCSRDVPHAGFQPGPVRGSSGPMGRRPVALAEHLGQDDLTIRACAGGVRHSSAPSMHRWKCTSSSW